MNTYDFDRITDRHNTACLKYDFTAERGYAPDVLPFWVADMDFPTAPVIIEALTAHSRHGIFGYTNVKNDYRDVLQNWFQTQHGWTPQKGSLVITPGVVFAICTAIRAFTHPGDAILIQPPVYYPFAASIRQNQRRVIENPLQYKDGRYAIDFADFEEKIIRQKVKLFLLCSPHNPVGRVWTKAELERIRQICRQHQVIIVADEIHHEFIRPGFTHTIFPSLTPELAAQTILCTSPSKTFNLAGLQISNIFIENQTLRRQFRAALSASGYDEPNALGYFAAQAAYTGGLPWLNELRAYLEQNLCRTRQFLAAELPKIRLVEPEGTYLLWLDFHAYGMTDEALDAHIKNDARLWLDSGHIFGREGSGFQRINIACPWETLEKGLQQLARAFKTL
jgi:cysteine-S-conjugate beta-lyase